MSPSTTAQQGVFYLLPQAFDHQPLLQAALSVIAKRWAAQRLFVLTEDETTARLLDQWLWRFDAERFIPHRIAGDNGLAQDVMIHWQPPTEHYDVLINLQKTTPKFAQRGQQVIDFVPTDEAGKQLARVRYREYQMMGLVLVTQQLEADTNLVSAE